MISEDEFVVFLSFIVSAVITFYLISLFYPVDVLFTNSGKITPIVSSFEDAIQYSCTTIFFAFIFIGIQLSIILTYDYLKRWFHKEIYYKNNK